MSNGNLFKQVSVKRRIRRKVRSVRESVLKKKIYLTPKEQENLLDQMLVHQRPQVLSKVEKKVLKNVCKNGLQEKYRRHLWLRASGALAAMNLEENRHYYRNLKMQPVQYPNPSYGQIELDLKRTFTELKVAKSERLIIKLRNVLTTYTKRNPTIGYCQGMNFLVGRLLKVIQGYSDTLEPTSASSSNGGVKKSMVSGGGS